MFMNFQVAKKRIKKLAISRYGLIILLILAAFLRLYKISSYMEFLGDQGRDVVIVRQFLTQGNLMFIGPQTSVGNMYLGPWYYYLIAPFLLLFNFNPRGPAVMVALLGIATVWLICKAGEEWFDRETGFLAAFLLAISPVIIYYSIFSWNPNVMPFFSLLSIWLIYRIWQNKEYKKMPWLGFSLAMALNSHYLGLLLLPVIGIFWLWGLKEVWRSDDKKSYILYSLFCLLVFFALMSPLLLFDIKHNFANFRAFRKFFATSQATVNLQFYKGFLKFPIIVNQLWANLIIRADSWSGAWVGTVVLFWGLWRWRKNRATWLLGMIFAMGILGLSNYKQDVYAHYFAFLWPVAILLIAAGLRKLLPLSLLLVAVLAWLMLANWHGWRPPVYQLQRAQKVAQFILDKSEGKEFSLALIAQTNYDPPYRYYLNLKKAPLVNLHETIPEQLFVICEPWGKVNCNPIGHPKWQIAAFGWAKIDKEWKINGVKIFKLIHTRQGVDNEENS